MVSSQEPKAFETAHLVARSMHAGVQVVEGLHEHDRSATPWLDPEEFARAVAAFFHRPAELVMGYETAHQASQRFGRAMAAVLTQHAEQNVIVFTHGTVLSLFVAHATGLEPLALWQRLGLPSFVVLTLPQLELVKVVEQITLTPLADARATDAQ
jgi:broad specificity phosphatase PhoE